MRTQRVEANYFRRALSFAQRRCIRDRGGYSARARGAVEDACVDV